MRNPRGVLLINLGTPKSPAPKHLRRHLRESLRDPHVDLGVNPILWWLILNLIVLPFRPRKSTTRYQKVWTEKGSPLTIFSAAQATGLEAALGDDFRVEFGYRYGEPSIQRALDQLTESGCRQVTALPLFPQESSAGYGTSVKHLEQIIDGWQGDAPEVRVAPPFFDEPGYIKALAARIRDTKRSDDAEHFVFSYHGIPLSFVERGEPYHNHCQATSEALATELGLEDGEWTHAYQSKFGKGQWLTPATADVLTGLAKKQKRVLVACPGFPADCLETIEEIGMRGAEQFRSMGGENLTLVPALNDHPRWIEAMSSLVRKELRPMGSKS